MSVDRTAGEQQTKRAVDRVGPAVVAVGRRGAGLVVAPGMVLTCAHHVHSDEVPVVGLDATPAVATVVGVDPDHDLAVLAVDTGDAQPPEWSPDPAAIGRPVLAVARSWTGTLRVTAGGISATDQVFRGPQGRRIAGAVEHTAPLARGSSGGPITDLAGRVIGLNTHRLADGFYLAVPTHAELRGRVDLLVSGEAPRRRRLGIAVAPATVARSLRAAVGLPAHDGVLVRGLEEDGPAGQAGLRPGDLVVKAGGEPVTDVDDLHVMLDRLEATSLTLDVLRGSDEIAVTVRFETDRS